MRVKAVKRVAAVRGGGGIGALEARVSSALGYWGTNAESCLPSNLRKRSGNEHN